MHLKHSIPASALFQIRTHCKGEVLQHVTRYSIWSEIHHLSIRSRTLHTIQSNVTGTKLSLRSSHRTRSRCYHRPNQSGSVSIGFICPTWSGWRETTWGRCAYTARLNALQVPCEKCVMVAKIRVHFDGTDPIPAANDGKGGGESWLQCEEIICRRNAVHGPWNTNQSHWEDVRGQQKRNQTALQVCGIWMYNWRNRVAVKLQFWFWMWIGMNDDQ